MEAKQLLSDANDELDRMVGRITNADWDKNVPTTPKWNLRQLVNHISQTNRSIAASLQGAPHVSESDNLDDPDPAANWRRSFDELSGTLNVFSDYDKTLTGPSGEIPASQMMIMMIGDRLAHTWDIAGPIGADRTLPAPLVETAYELWEKVAPHVERGEALGEIVDVPEDASLQDKFLALTGRDPRS
jgi:uncharacterized protein (TIGR03086 family)